MNAIKSRNPMTKQNYICPKIVFLYFFKTINKIKIQLLNNYNNQNNQNKSNNKMWTELPPTDKLITNAKIRAAFCVFYCTNFKPIGIEKTVVKAIKNSNVDEVDNHPEDHS